MKKLTLSIAILAMVGVASASLVPNGDFETAGGVHWSSFASAGAVISFPTTGGNSGGYGVVDNTAGDWGGGLVSPADFEYAGNTGIPLATLGLTAGETYTFQMDMINLAGTGVGGVKFESWGAAHISNSGDLPASGQSASWATYSWEYTIDAAATSIKIVPLITPNYAQPDVHSSIGFDNVGVIPEPATLGLLGLVGGGMLFLRRLRRF